jgi:UDP-N-acetylmuramoylalanine--D-glutamate ligase
MVESSHDHTWNVLELSSFQLETIQRFRARIAACSNVTPDHLDRHHTFENYAAAKARLFETQQVGDVAALNYDDATCRGFAEYTKATVYWFSSSQRVPGGLWMAHDRLFYNDEPFMTRSQIPLVGMHNVENVMAAALMAHLAGANLDALPPAIASFPGVEHRIEFVRELHGVKYYNDSKATNVDATLKAVNAFSGNLWVILGGKDKGASYAPLRPALAAKGKGALLIGAAAPLIGEALDGELPLMDCGTLSRAVEYAHSHAQPGDTVLLAPACASFDQFQNYEERGRTFKHLVKELS